ncbi:MAG TPA: NUDIX domain-containing protein [Thermoanaerobaculia bacterium]|jgi:isopentenyldiphosphate isomerase|nr:NUDIX domain-containing protein [Thermoanaerobaculia bacterium]
MTINTVDDHNQILGTMARKFVLPTAHNFRVAHLLLSNLKGEILLQQLARSRDRHPLAWGASVACYLFAGESYEEAIRRRVFQELGCESADIALLDQLSMHDGESNKFIGLFTGKAEGPFRVDSSHIERVEFVSPQEIEAELRDGSRAFTPTFRYIYPIAAPKLRG